MRVFDAIDHRIRVLYVDDVRSPQFDLYNYKVARSTNQAIKMIEEAESVGEPFSAIDIDHDAGEYASDGGDYIKVLEWLEETGREYVILIHSLNVVGVENMLRICQRNNWLATCGIIVPGSLVVK